MGYRLVLSYLKTNFLAILIVCFAIIGCTSTYKAYDGELVPGRLKVVSIPGSCYYYVKDTLTGLCWLSCFDQSMIADDACRSYEKAFAGRRIEGANSTALEESKQNSEVQSQDGTAPSNFMNSPDAEDKKKRVQDLDEALPTPKKQLNEKS
ncbi:MAG: hypothetical protein AB8G05_05940 [Oligoflexales bacterium]